ncbi:EF-hand [Dendrothele bispora CBS 962.96]|uniref:EF-hand n=1 Tax=Dendrothele bispora (strain CBS 962.96) TaxID=1314807 RepID=A0A4S8KSM8_DENBC|nr:EF-hand [Dendrothele bispora CBS 962.96]
MPTTHQNTVTPLPSESQYNEVSATLRAPGGPGGGYGGYDEAPPPDSYGQQPLPDALGISATGSSMGPDTEHQLQDWFAAVNKDKSGRITARDLKRILKNGDWTPFDIETVKKLMSIVDQDRKGTIGFKQYIKEWQVIFRQFDSNNSGSIDGGELGEALSQISFRSYILEVSPRLLNFLQEKYGTTTDGQHQISISFGRFICACFAIKRWTEVFQLDGARNGWSYDEFMYHALTVLETGM